MPASNREVAGIPNPGLVIWDIPHTDRWISRMAEEEEQDDWASYVSVITTFATALSVPPDNLNRAEQM